MASYRVYRWDGRLMAVLQLTPRVRGGYPFFRGYILNHGPQERIRARTATVDGNTVIRRFRSHDGTSVGQELREYGSHEQALEAARDYVQALAGFIQGNPPQLTMAEY